MISLNIELGHEVMHPHTLFVMEDQDAIRIHKEQFIPSLGPEVILRDFRAKVITADGRRFQYTWTWPREVYGIWKDCTRWVYLYAGNEFSKIVIDTPLEQADLIYLIGRMRGIPLNPIEKE